MNLRARFLGLISLSALLFFSCEEDISKIGLPPENNLGIFFAEIPLEDLTTQVWTKDLDTRNTGLILTGAYMDPNFGLIETKNYSEVDLAIKEYNATATLDSAVLEFRVNSAAGTQVEDVLHTFEIYQLANPISLTVDDEARSFNSSTTEPLSDKIAEYSVKIHLDSIGLAFSDTNIDLDDGVNDKEDSAFYEAKFDANDFYIYQHKARLDDNFAQKIFLGLKTNLYDSADKWADFFKGIHIRSTGNNGAIVSYLTGSNSTLSFYYHEDNESKKISFPISTNRSYNNIAPNDVTPWSGSDFDGLNKFYTPFTPGTGKIYLQSGTNLIAKVDMRPIRAGIMDTLPDAIVHSAEILLTGNENTTLNTPSNLVYQLTSLDSLANNKAVVTQIPSLSGGTVTSSYNSDISGYKLEAPYFIEILTSVDEFEFDQLIIAPFDPSSGSLPRARINAFISDKSNLKLRIYYTLPNVNQ